jgi:hypothetical protein
MYRVLETPPKGCYQKIITRSHIEDRDKINALRQAGYRMNPDSYRQRMKNDGMVEFFRKVYYKEIL